MRRPCGSIKASFALDFVLRLDFVIGAERDHVGALFCVVGNAAPVERGQAVGTAAVYAGETLLAEAEVKSAADAPRLTFGGAMELLWQSLLGA